MRDQCDLGEPGKLIQIQRKGKDLADGSMAGRGRPFNCQPQRLSFIAIRAVNRVPPATIANEIASSPVTIIQPESVRGEHSFQTAHTFELTFLSYASDKAIERLDGESG